VLCKLTIPHIVLCSLGFLVPHILVKFISTSFASQDVDIVHYMWVKGNLKDNLGIRRRRIKWSLWMDLHWTPKGCQCLENLICVLLPRCQPPIFMSQACHWVLETTFPILELKNLMPPHHKSVHHW